MLIRPPILGHGEYHRVEGSRRMQLLAQVRVLSQTAHTSCKLMHVVPAGIRPFLLGPPSAHIGTLRHGCWAHNDVGSAYCIVPDASKLSSYPQLPMEEVRSQYRLHIRLVTRAARVNAGVGCGLTSGGPALANGPSWCCCRM